MARPIVNRSAFGLLVGAVGVGVIMVLIGLAEKLNRPLSAVDEWLDRPVSLEYRDIPLREALDHLCEVEGCSWRSRGAEIVIAPLSPPTPLARD